MSPRSIGRSVRVDRDDVGLTSTYYDTPSLGLLRQRVTLRRREGDADTGWHLKVPAGDARTELRLPLSAGAHVPERLVELVTRDRRRSRTGSGRDCEDTAPSITGLRRRSPRSRDRRRRGARHRPRRGGARHVLARGRGRTRRGRRTAVAEGECSAARGGRDRIERRLEACPHTWLVRPDLADRHRPARIVRRGTCPNS